MEYSPSFADSLQADIKPSYSDSLMHGFDDKKFGLPKAKKYPMPDIAHVRSAIKFFNYVDRAHEKELAKAILARMHEYGIDPSDINVGDTNRFKKYLPQTELKHHGIKGMKWGVRRYQNRNGSLTSKGKARKGMSESTKKKLKTAAKVAAGAALAGAVGYGLYKSGAAGKAIGAVKSYKPKKSGPSGGKKHVDPYTERLKNAQKKAANNSSRLDDLLEKSGIKAKSDMYRAEKLRSKPDHVWTREDRLRYADEQSKKEAKRQREERNKRGHLGYHYINID